MRAIEREAIEDAIANERLVVKVGAGWFLARKVKTSSCKDGAFIMHVRAGPHNARGFITNIDDNAQGRQFRILPTNAIRC